MYGRIRPLGVHCIFYMQSLLGVNSTFNSMISNDILVLIIMINTATTMYLEPTPFVDKHILKPWRKMQIIRILYSWFYSGTRPHRNRQASTLPQCTPDQNRQSNRARQCIFFFSFSVFLFHTRSFQTQQIRRPPPPHLNAATQKALRPRFGPTMDIHHTAPQIGRPPKTMILGWWQVAATEVQSLQ